MIPWHDLVRITEGTSGRVWIEFDDWGLPFFRFGWRWAPWGPWWGWN